MGLDMYLATNAEASTEQLIEAVREAGLLRFWYDQTPQLIGSDDEHPEGVYPIVAYWRKANAIHGWIVRELADGVDECQQIPISRAQMSDLRDRCARVLAADDKGEAAQQEGLMPTSGFFFGSTDVDQYYEADLRDTVTQLTAVLDAAPLSGASFHYQASW